MDCPSREALDMTARTATSHRMPGRLSVFQRMMLLWNNFHSYNAVHVVRIERPFDKGRLEKALDAEVEGAGLTGLVVDAASGGFEYLGGPAGISVRVIEGPPGEPALLEREVESELNTPFAIDAPFTPLRFFAIPGDGFFRLGLAYCHFICDADPIVRLLTNVARGFGGEVRTPQAADRYVNMRRLILPVALRYGLRWLLTFPRLVSHRRRSSRPLFQDKGDFSNGLLLSRVARGELASAVRAASSWGVTLNDLFLAAFVKAIAPVAAARAKGRRNLIAVSSIASMRKDLGADLSSKTGPFLGVFSVFCPVPGETRLREVAADVHAETARIKKYKLHIRALVEFRIGLFFLGRYSPQRQQAFHIKSLPLWGGITGVNLSDLASQSAEHGITDYLRAVSTGPMCPTIFSITTFGDGANVAVSFRKTVFSADEVRMITGRFRALLADPSEEAAGARHGAPGAALHVAGELERPVKRVKA